MPTPPRAPVQFKDRAVEQQLAARSQPGYGNGAGAVAARDLARYYRLLALELRRVWLTEPEAALLCDALHGVHQDADTLPLLWAIVDDASRAGLAGKWGVADPGALVLKLRELSPAQTFAVADACERFWVRAGDENTADRLVAVGLIQQDE